MRVGQMIFYITSGKLHYGKLLHNDKGILRILEKNRVSKKKASQVAWEVSNECRRFGLKSSGTGGKEKDSVSTNGDSRYIASVDRCKPLESI